MRPQRTLGARNDAAFLALISILRRHEVGRKGVRGITRRAVLHLRPAETCVQRLLLGLVGEGAGCRGQLPVQHGGRLRNKGRLVSRLNTAAIGGEGD